MKRLFDISAWTPNDRRAIKYVVLAETRDAALDAVIALPGIDAVQVNAELFATFIDATTPTKGD